MVSDDGALREVVENVIRDNPQSVEDYHARQEEGDRFPGWTDDESHAWQGGSSENQQASGRALINLSGAAGFFGQHRCKAKSKKMIQQL